MFLDLSLQTQMEATEAETTQVQYLVNIPKQEYEFHQPPKKVSLKDKFQYSIQFNSIKVNPSISTKEPDGDSTPHAYNSHTTIIQQVKEPADILYQIHR